MLGRRSSRLLFLALGRLSDDMYRDDADRQRMATGHHNGMCMQA